MFPLVVNDVRRPHLSVIIRYAAVARVFVDGTFPNPTWSLIAHVLLDILHRTGAPVVKAHVVERLACDQTSQGIIFRGNFDLLPAPAIALSAWDVGPRWGGDDDGTTIDLTVVAHKIGDRPPLDVAPLGTSTLRNLRLVIAPAVAIAVPYRNPAFWNLFGFTHDGERTTESLGSMSRKMLNL